MRDGLIDTLARWVSRLPKWLIIVVFFVSLGLATFAYLTTSTYVFWEEIPLNPAKMEPLPHPAGNKAYVIKLPSGHMDQAKEDPCPAKLIESGPMYPDRKDGRPVEFFKRFLPSPNAMHADIAGKGNGRFSYWDGTLIFAPWDNSDPRTSGRFYAAYWPRFHYQSWWFIPAYVLLGVSSLLLFTMVPGIFAYMRRNVSRPDLFVICLFQGLFAASLIYLAYLMVVDYRAVPWNPIWYGAAFAGLMATLATRRRYGKKSYWKAALPAVLALAVCFYLITAVADNKTTGCQDKEHTSWQAFCVSGDSASYYTGWSPRIPSTRQPFYPWFIHLVTGGKHLDPHDYRNFGKLRNSTDDPLLWVSRAQIVILLGSALVVCATMMLVTYSVLPAMLFLGFYCFGYLGDGLLNVILTEPLTQTWQMLILAAFLAFLWRRKAYLLPLTGVLCALSYLTRQASVYTLLFLGTMLLVAMHDDWRKYLKSAALSLALAAALAFLPDMLVLATTGDLSANQATLQYQYRMAYAVQFAQPEDIDLMPDQESRDFFKYMLERREIEHRKVDQQMSDPFNRMIYHINANVYYVAVQPGREIKGLVDLWMKVATPILKAHHLDHLLFGLKFWSLAMVHYTVDRLGFNSLGGWWWALLIPAALILLIRGLSGLAALVMVTAHYSHVLLCCLFAAPLARMVGATDGLVVVAAYLLAWRALEWLLGLVIKNDAGVEPLTT